MKRKCKPLFAVTISIVMGLALLSGCAPSGNASSSTTSAPPVQSVAPVQSAPQTAATPEASKPEEQNQPPTPLVILSPEDGRVVNEDNPVWLELEKRTNTELELLLLPGAEIPSKLNTMAASNTLPDIVKRGDFFPYAQQDLLLDIGDLVDEYGSNLKEHLPEHLWEYTKYKGVQVAIPYYNDAGKHVMSIRQDWLDKLGLKKPENLDDLFEIAVKFANEDPDGNGEKDSYAFATWTDFMPVFGAYGIMDGRYYYIQDNKSYTTNTAPEYKEVLAYINKLWQANAIDPDFLIMQTDQYRQKLAQGKIGMQTDWWSIIPEIVIGQLGFKELNPDGEWAIIETAPKGSGGPLGNNGMRSNGEYANATWLSANTKYPVEAIKFLDFLMSDEGYELSYYGIQGQHYITMEEGRTPEGLAGFEEKWLDSFNQIVGRRLDIVHRMMGFAKEEKVILGNAYQNAGFNYNLYISAFFGLPATDADLTYGADLDNYEKENRIAFATGEKSLDEYDAYVQEWIKRGGGEILKEQTEQYNSMRNENIEPGLK